MRANKNIIQIVRRTIRDIVCRVGSEQAIAARKLVINPTCAEILIHNLLTSEFVDTGIAGEQ
jgi:hypothetical protein